jgi:TP901 family phage tail tape measure protein
MNVIDTLFLSLGVDAKGIDKGLNEARAKIQAGAQGLANSLMAPFKSALGALAAGLSLGAVTNQYLQQADAIGKMADSIGVDMEELQAWGEAAARAGGSAQGFQQSLQSMNRSLQLAAQGQGEAAKMFQTFGIKVTDANGKARDSLDVLRDLAGAMEGMDKQKAMGFGQRLGLDRGTIMLLQSGKVAVDDLIRRQKELGVYTKEDAEITAKANDAIADLGQSMKAAAAIFMRAIVPAITWVTEHLTALVQDFRKHKTFYLAALGAIAAFLTAKMIPTLVKVGLLNARIWAPYAVVASIIAGLALIFDDLWTYMNGGKSALEDYWKTLGTGPELLEKFNKAWQAVKEKGGAVLEGLKNIAKGVFDFFLAHIDSFMLMFDGVWDMLDGLFNFDFKKIGNGLGKAFTGAWQLISSVFDNIFSGMDKMSVWDAVKNGAVAVWDAIKKIAVGFFEGLPKEAQDKLVRLWTDIKAAFHWDELKEAFAAIWNIDWEKIKNAVIDTFNQAIAAIKKMFSDWIDGLIAQIKGIIDMIPGVDTVKNAAGAVGDAVSGAWGTVKGWFGGNDAAAATPSPKDAVSAQAAAAANVTETTNNTTNNDSHNTYNITVNNQPNAKQFAADLESFGRRGTGLGRMAASGQTN